jgi:hypothetical protein
MHIFSPPFQKEGDGILADFHSWLFVNDPGDC